jgi:hypothetical protein
MPLVCKKEPGIKMTEVSRSSFDQVRELSADHPFDSKYRSAAK